MNKKLNNLIVIILLALGLLVRLYKINAPLADWHSFRQADTAAVAKIFLKDGYDLLHPRYFNLSKTASGMENPQGYRFVEFPLYNAIHAFSYQLTENSFPNLSFEVVGRLVSIFFWLLAGIWLYKIIKLRLDDKTAIIALFFFLFLPFAIYYSRTILPEPMMIALSLGSIYYFLNGKSISADILGLVLAALAILVKPYAIFLLLPSMIYVFGRKKKFVLGISLIFFSFLPFLAWRFWMKQYPEGVPLNSWLLNAKGIRFRPAWWRWLFGERLGKLILGTWGTTIFSLGLIKRIDRKSLLFWTWLAGAFAYLAIFASGNVQHDYYQILLLPSVVAFLALGIGFILTLPKNKVSRAAVYPFLAALTIFSLAFSWYSIKDYYLINRIKIVEAGKEADAILPPDAKVIAPYGGDTAFLYHVNRPGWAVITDSVQETIMRGATHYVSVDFNADTNKVIKNCSIVKRSADHWVIVDLRTCQFNGEKANQQ